MLSVPFQLPDLNGGLTEIKGVASLDEEFLVLEVETALFGEFSKEQQTVKIEPRALQEVRLERGLFRDKLCLRPKKRDLLEALPGSYLGEVKLKIWVKHRRAAEALYDALRNRRERSSRSSAES